MKINKFSAQCTISVDVLVNILMDSTLNSELFLNALYFDINLIILNMHYTVKYGMRTNLWIIWI